MKKILATLAAGTAIAAATPALAQDAQGFSGPRVEALVGYDHHRSGSTKDIDTDGDVDQSINGATYGAAIGYDIATGSNMVVGVEAELTDSSAKWDAEGGPPSTFNLGKVEAGRDIYAGARVGFVASPSTMFYVKGGYTNARYELLGTDGTTTLDQRLDTDGWRAGAGVEQKFGSNAYGKLEYRYSNYSEGEFDFDGDTPDSSRFNIDTDRHQVVAAVGLRF
jgi:outer membrane immunogenic protein